MYNNVYDLQTLYLIIMFKSAPSEDKTPYGRPLALWILRGGLGGMCLGMGMERDGCHEAQARIHGHHEAWKLGKKDNAVSCLCFRLVHRRRVKKRINAWVNHKGTLMIRFIMVPVTPNPALG